MDKEGSLFQVRIVSLDARLLCMLVATSTVIMHDVVLYVAAIQTMLILRLNDIHWRLVFTNLPHHP